MKDEERSDLAQIALLAAMMILVFAVGIVIGSLHPVGP